VLKPIKIMLICIVASILILLVIVCSLLFVIDINDFKPEISRAIKNRTGRDVTFNEQLKLTLFPELSLSTGSIVLGNPDGFQGYFMAVDDISLRLKPLPLLRKKIDADIAQIRGFKLNLITTPQGLHNWDTVFSKTTDTPTNMAALMAGLSINGINIENARINWNNQQSGQNIEVNNVNLTTTSIAINTPITSHFSLLAVDKANQITASLTGQTTLTFNGNLDTFTLINNRLHATLTHKLLPEKPLAFTLNSPEVLVDKTRQAVKASEFQLKLANLIVTSDMMASLNTPPTLNGKIRIMPFNPSQLMAQLALPQPPHRDKTVLQHLDGQFSFHATRNGITFSPLLMTLDDSSVTGSVLMNDYAKPTSTFNLAIDSIAVDRYLPPMTKNSKTTDPAAILAIMPVETLRKLRTTGSLAINKLAMNNATLRHIQLTVGE
jgi:AsmA protein